MIFKISIGTNGGKGEDFGFDVKFDNGGTVVFFIGFAVFGDLGSEECATNF
jgi:hypothetical protein